MCRPRKWYLPTIPAAIAIAFVVGASYLMMFAGIRASKQGIRRMEEQQQGLDATTQRHDFSRE